MAQNSVKAVPLSGFNSAAVLNNFQPINPGGFPESPFFVRINNASNSGIIISFDGVTDHDVVLANDFLDIPTQTNAQPGAWVALFPKYTVVFVRGVAGVGTIFLSAYYV